MTAERGNISDNIEAILQEKNRLEQMLRDKFKKEVVILFTDICDYTQYTDTYGDISGRALLQKHNQIVLPIIKQHSGLVIKTIGDAVMASFADPLQAVKASIAIQQNFSEYNQKVEAKDQIHVRLGLNIGYALVDGDDVFGDVVNVASRIQSQAEPDQTLISKNLYLRIRGVEDIICRSHGTVQVKGKLEPLELYRIAWRDEDIILSSSPQVRTSRLPSLGYSSKTMKILHLEAICEDVHLKISLTEHLIGEESTIQSYETTPLSLEWIKKKCQELVEAFNLSNRQGRFRRELFLQFREAGREFYEKLLTPAAKDKLKRTEAEYLRLVIDDQAVQIPWELLNDGQEFLCQRFNMGRLVKTRQSAAIVKERVLAKPLRLLIIADPKGDLKNAYEEGLEIRDYMAQYDKYIEVTLCSKEVTPLFLKEKMKYFDLVHFAGHSEYLQEKPEKGGWRLSEGLFTAQDIIDMAPSSTMPSLIFSNACQTAQTEEWHLKEHFQDKIFGVAKAFLLAGVKHYVGTFWEILDEPSNHFAQEFYRYLLLGSSTGEAMRKARLSLMREYGEETIVWASYLLYGDPSFNYLDQLNGLELKEKDASVLTRTSPALEAQPGLAGPEPKATNQSLKTQFGIKIGLLTFISSLLFFSLSVFIIKKLQTANHSTQPKLSIQPLTTLLQGEGEGEQGSDLQKTFYIIQLLSSYQDQLWLHKQKQGFFKKRSEHDSWSSSPVSLCLISPNWAKISSQEMNSLRPHYNQLVKTMTEALLKTRSLGLTILERERLAILLQELHLGLPQLSQPILQDASNLLSAKVILFLEPVGYTVDNYFQSEVSLRLVETKSSKIIGAFSDGFTPQPESVNETVDRVVRKMLQILQAWYPLQGKILSINSQEQQVQINLGSSCGVLPDQFFAVLSEDAYGLPKGIMLVKAVTENTAMAHVKEQKRPFLVGDRIKAMPIKALEKRL